MSDSELVLGYLGALIASIFFGSNYVPTKNYPTGDGFSFVWVFASGVFTVGFLSIFINGGCTFVYTGLIGGSLWATGNLCVIPIVKTIGLGLGLLLWGSTSLITGFFLGKIGLFGLHKDVVSNAAMNWVGICCIIGAMAVFFFIKPTLDNKDGDDPSAPLLPTTDSGNIQNRIAPKRTYPVEEATTPSGNESFFDRLPAKTKPIIGVSLAIFSGIFYGTNMLPMSLWVQKQTKTPQPLEFVFSHFSGIYFFSTFVYIIYLIVKRPPQIFPQSILPSYISGAMWGIAQCGLMIATNALGYTIGFPIGSAGPLIVSSLWSVLYFREIRGVRNLSFLLSSFALLGTGIALLAKSH